MIDYTLLLHSSAFCSLSGLLLLDEKEDECDRDGGGDPVRLYKAFFSAVSFLSLLACSFFGKAFGIKGSIANV